MVDHPDDASGAGHGQQGVAGVGVVGPSARVEVLVRLGAGSSRKTKIDAFSGARRHLRR